MAENARKTNCWSRRITGGMMGLIPMGDTSQLSWGQALSSAGYFRGSYWAFVPLSPPLCIRQDRAPVMDRKGWRAALCALGWPDRTWKDCPDISIAAPRTPLQGIGVLRCCFILSICGELLSPGHAVGVFAPLLAESLVYLLLNLVLVHPK